jgi:hypothetical protein
MYLDTNLTSLCCFISKKCSDTEEPPELSSNSSSPATHRRSPLQPPPPQTPSTIALNTSIRVVNEPLIDAVDNFARPQPKEDELKNESCEADAYRLAEKSSLNMVLSTKPTAATQEAIENMVSRNFLKLFFLTILWCWDPRWLTNSLTIYLKIMMNFS